MLSPTPRTPRPVSYTLVSKLWFAVYLVGLPVSFVYPAFAFPMCLQTFPLRIPLICVYTGSVIASVWLPWMKWIAPILLLPGSNGAFFIDHLVMYTALYASMWSSVLCIIVSVVIGVYYGRYQFQHSKHVQIF